MSQFGQRDIPITPMPQAAVDTSVANTIGLLRDVFNTAVDTTSAFGQLQLQREQQRQVLTQIEHEQQMRPGELERAQQVLEIEEMRTETVRARIDNDLAMAEYERLRQIELDETSGLLAGLTPEQSAAYLKANPQRAPENQEAVAKVVADRLLGIVQSDIEQRLYQQRRDTGAAPGTAFTSDAVLSALDAQELGGLPDSIRADLYSRAFRYGYGVERGIIAQEDQQQRSALANTARESVQRHAQDFALGISTYEDARASSAEHSMFDPSVAGEWDIKRFAQSAVMATMNRVQAGAVPPMDAMNLLYGTGDREFTATLNRMGVRDTLLNLESSRVRSVVKSTDEAVKQQIDLAKGIADAPGLRAYAEQLESIVPVEASDKLGVYQSQIQSALRDISTFQSQANTVYNHVTGATDAIDPAMVTQAAVNRADSMLQNMAGLSPTRSAALLAGQYGMVPQEFQRQLRASLDSETLNIAWVAENMDAILEANSDAGERLLRATPGGKIGRAFFAATGDQGEHDHAAQRAVGVLSSSVMFDAFAIADNALMSGETLQSRRLDRSDRRIEGMPEEITTPHLMIARSLGTANVSEAAVVKFEDLYRYYTAEAMVSRPGIANDQALAYAEQRASERMREMFHVFQSDDPNTGRTAQIPVSRRTLGIADPHDVQAERFINSTVTTFQRLVSESSQDSSFVIFDSARRINGQTYIYAADGAGEVTNILEIDAPSGQHRFIDSTSADFEALSIGLDPNRLAGGRWHYLMRGQDTGEQSITQYDARYGTSRSDQALDAAVTEWVETFGEQPVLESQEFRQFATEFIRTELKWGDW